MANERMMADILRQQPENPAPQPEMLGTGMAASAARDIQAARRYKMYAAEAAAMGEAPMSYEQWLASGQ